MNGIGNDWQARKDRMMYRRIAKYGGVNNPQAPLKSYSKTDPVDLPPVKAQVLRGGKLVDVERPCMSSLMHDTTLPPQF